MRVLICSYVFAPSIGGIETAGAILADQWTRLGLSVTVATETPGDQVFPNYEIVRRPTLRKLRALAKSSDIVFQNNISLRSLIPLLPSSKPVVIAHHAFLRRGDGERGWQEHLKCAMLPLCHNVAVSKAIAQSLPVDSILIYDPFDPGEFAPFRSDKRDRDIVFMGRLVHGKGCHLALQALQLLRADGVCPTLTVIGDGPEMPELKRMTAEMELSSQVTFTGALRGERGRNVARHAIMVIPSVSDEGFGIVALEGLAAGCVLVSSEAGGLPEAVGPCGLVFPKGDVRAMASALRHLLTDRSLQDKLASQSVRHLEQFRPETIAKQYLGIFETALRTDITARQRRSGNSLSG